MSLILQGIFLTKLGVKIYKTPQILLELY